MPPPLPPDVVDIPVAFSRLIPASNPEVGVLRLSLSLLLLLPISARADDHAHDHRPAPLKATSLPGHASKINAIAFSPDGRLAASGSGGKSGLFGKRETYLDCVARVWDLQTRQPIAKLEAHDRPLKQVLFSADARLLLTAAEDERIIVWDIGGQKKLHEFKGTLGRFLPDDRVAVATRELHINIHDLATGEQINQLVGHSGGANAIAVSPDGQSLLTAGNDRTARLWSLKSGKATRNFKPHDLPITAVAFLDATRYLSVSAGDGAVRIVDIASGEAGSDVKLQSDQTINHLLITPAAHLLIVGTDDTVQLWDAATGKQAKTFPLQFFPSLAAVSPDGKALLSASPTTSALLLYRNDAGFAK